MSNFACLAVQSGEAAAPGCACAGCQDAFGAAMLGGPAPAPANGTTDVPGDLTTTISLTVGTPITGVLEVNGDHDWYAVNLVAGTRYQITLNGVAVDGYGALEDPYLYLRNAIGGLIVENDDIRSGVLRNSRISWVATEAGQYFLDAGAWDENFVGGYQLSIIEFTPPNYSLDEIVDFLTTGFWGDGGRRWDISTDNIITFNVMGLDLAGQTLARAAFQSWATVTNLMFEEVNSGGDITLDDNQPRAFASSSVSNGFITSTNINISTAWLSIYGTAIDSYSFQTYVHEIGHALGLGHGGHYNETANHGLDNLYVNDVWSNTIMSYFDQAEAAFGSYRYVMGPSVADILAVQNLYGANTSFNAENTVYGRNATGGSLYDFASYTTVPAFSIYDAGGSDTLDASGYGASQVINLNAEAFSSIGGLTNNIAIARGVVIEAAIGGDGSDSIIGNAGDNLLMGNAGADSLDGGAASDSLVGGAGDDSLNGGAGMDFADYGSVSGAVTVNLATGTVSGSDIGTDTLLGIEGATGGQGADSFIGDAGDNLLSGNAGSDTLIGDVGADSLIGGAGDDLLITDGMGDYLEAGDGDDVILLGGTSLADILGLFGPWG